MPPAAPISGSTRLYGLVGDPLKNAKSPSWWNRVFADHGVDAVCVPFVVGAGQLPAFAAGARTVRNLSGLLVTMPHKPRMLELVDELHGSARQVGAVNVVRCDDDGRWVGANVDGIGCVHGMRTEGHDPAGKNVLLLGAGGTGRAIAFAIASAGARSLAISDVDPRRAEALAQWVADVTGCRAGVAPPDPLAFDIVINATPLGMNADDPLPIDPDRLRPGSVVVDIVISPEPTPLCRAAQARGCRTQDGRVMHEGQALHAMAFLGFAGPSGFAGLSETRSVPGAGLSPAPQAALPP